MLFPPFPLPPLDSGSKFVRTKLFIELEEDFKMYKAGSTCTLMCLLGPKGVGKTTAMEQLMRDRNNDNDMFIDLSEKSISEVITIKRNCEVLFIDNAQMYGDYKETLTAIMLRKTFVVAAFSPGVRCKDGLHILVKACKDGQDASFFFRPFTFEEAIQLPSVLGFKIGDTNNFKDKIITQRRFNWLFCIANGIPRYIRWYFEGNFDTKRMWVSLARQYEESRKNIPVPDEVIDRNVLALVVSGQCEESNPAVILGLAYCTKNSGSSRYKPASAYFAQRALARLSGGECFGLPWQKLETLTHLLISATTCEIISTNDKIALPQASKCVHQPNIGDTCDSQILDGVVTLLILAEKHNVIDFILYDRRPAKADVYFIQISSANYKKKVSTFKDRNACTRDPVKKDSIVKSEFAISEHYTKFLKKGHNFIYVYATTDLEKWQSHPNVYFFNLLKFNPAVYSYEDE